MGSARSPGGLDWGFNVTCALVVAAIRAGKIPRPGKEGVRVTLPGGDLFIEWREENNRVYMKGPATLSFKGAASLK